MSNPAPWHPWLQWTLVSVLLGGALTMALGSPPPDSRLILAMVMLAVLIALPELIERKNVRRAVQLAAIVVGIVLALLLHPSQPQLIQRPGWALVLIVVVFLVAIAIWLAISFNGVRSANRSATSGGFLDVLLDMQRVPEQMTPVMARITKEMHRMGQRIDAHTAAILRARARPDGGTITNIHRSASRAARDMNWYAARISRHHASLHELAVRLSGTFDGLIEIIRSQPIDRGALVGFRAAIYAMSETSAVTAGQISSYRDVVVGLRGISGEVNLASDNLAYVVTGVLEAIESVRLACERLLPVIDERLSEGALHE